MFVRNCWYVIAWDHEIPAEQANGAIFTRTVLCEPIVVYRSSTGLVCRLSADGILFVKGGKTSFILACFISIGSRSIHICP